MISLSDFAGRSKVIGLKPIVTKSSTLTLTEEEQRRNADILYQNAEKAMREAEQEAEIMLAGVRQQIQTEQMAWQEEKKLLETEAKEQGFQEGVETGRQEGFETYSEMIEKARQVIEEAKQDCQSILTESEDIILHLALSAASKILDAEVKAESGYVEMVRQVIKEVKDQKKIAVYAHPEDYQVLLRQKEELINIVHFDADLAIYPDSELTRGACIIESPYGRLDAGIDSQLQEMRNKLFDLAREADSES